MMMSSYKSAMKLSFLLVFVGWLMVWVLLPTNRYKYEWTPKLNTELDSKYFREQGFYISPFMP